MDAEILAVGSEILAGQIANTNARSISGALAAAGVTVVRQTAVGDGVDTIAAAIREALGRAGVLVISGGLGPTHDDLTREGLAAATGRGLERQASLVAMLEQRFAAMGRTMSPSNLRQAELPAGAVTIANPLGTAPGIFLEHEGRLVYVVPGVPDEMAAMVAGFVLPDLVRRGGGSALVTRTLRTTGIGESDLADRLAGVVGPNVGVYASEGEVRVTLTASPSDPSGLPALERRVRDLLGDLVYGEGDTSLERVVSDVLRARGLHLAVAESLTGGMLASRIVGVPGASDVLLAGYVAYSAAAKVRDLGVPPSVIEEHGLVSTETAVAMATGARLRGGADVALSTTGEAGPLPAEAAVGRVVVGLSWGDVPGGGGGGSGAAAWSYGMGGGRQMIRRRTCTYALDRLRRWLLGTAG